MRVAGVFKAVWNCHDYAVRLRAIAHHHERIDFGNQRCSGLEVAFARVEIEEKFERRKNRWVYLRANCRNDFHQRVTVLAAQRLEQRRLLRLRCLNINDRLNLAVALVHRAGPTNYAGKVEAGQVHVAEIAPLDTHADHTFAVVGSRELIEITGATGVAIAVFEPRALHEPLGSHTASFPSATWDLALSGAARSNTGTKGNNSSQSVFPVWIVRDTQDFQTLVTAVVEIYEPDGLEAEFVRTSGLRLWQRGLQREYRLTIAPVSISHLDDVGGPRCIHPDERGCLVG